MGKVLKLHTGDDRRTYFDRVRCAEKCETHDYDRRARAWTVCILSDPQTTSTLRKAA